MAITFRRLQVFVAAAEDCNFRRTADRLGISQPSVSAQIRSIESHLGYELFERRRGGKARLSHDGQQLLAGARELVKAEGSLSLERRLAPQASAGILRVSAGPLLLETRFKPRLVEFHERNPQLSLDFLPYDPSGNGEKALRAGAFDVLVYTGYPPSVSKVHTEILTRASCSVYSATRVEAPPGAERRLSALPFLMPPRHYRIGRWFESQLASIGIRPRNVVARPPYLDVTLRMCAAGNGLAVLFDEHARAAVERGELHIVRPLPVAAYRVMMLGRRALQRQMAPALRFLRAAARAPSRSSVASQGEHRL